MSIAVQIAQHLPFLRRFARALTGNQALGDEQVVKLLEAILADYDRHARAAREIAVAHFSPEAVLIPLVEKATAGA